MDCRPILAVCTVAILLTSLLGLTAPSPVMAQAMPMTEVTTSPIGPVVVVSSCTGEAVTITGTTRAVNHVTFDPNGGGHFRFFMGDQGTGIGSPSGNQYMFGDTVSVESNFPSGNSFEFSQDINSRLFTAGPNNNQIIHGTLHVTFNGNGGFTAFIDNFSIDCR